MKVTPEEEERLAALPEDGAFFAYLQGLGAFRV